MLRCFELIQQLQESIVHHNASILQLHDNNSVLQDVLTASKFQVSFVLNSLHQLEICSKEKIRRLRVEIVGHIEDKTRYMLEISAEVNALIATNTQKIECIELCHRDELQDLHIKLLKTKNDLAQLKLKCIRHSVTNSSILLPTNRKRKDLSNLSLKGRHAHRVR